MHVALRSQSGDRGSESCFSLSPCWKNSSIILAVHWQWVSQGLVGLDTSAVCSSRHNTLLRCSSVSWKTLRIEVGRKGKISIKNTEDGYSEVDITCTCIYML